MKAVFHPNTALKRLLATGLSFFFVFMWGEMALSQAGAQVGSQSGPVLKPDLAGEIIAELAKPTGAGEEQKRETLSFPLLQSDYTVDVQGSLASVTLVQTFINPTEKVLNATYLFPLHQKAAVHAMQMEMGDEIVKAVIREKKEARKTFETAKREGKAASLLMQHRPNMFTQEIANLMPGVPIKITLQYVQTVPKIDHAYELVLPMIVGPRYEGVQTPETVADTSEKPVPAHLEIPLKTPEAKEEGEQVEHVSGWTIAKVPAYPPVIGLNAPDTIDPKRVSFHMVLQSSIPISGLSSDTHSLDVTGTDNDVTVTFADGRVIDNRDLVIRYTLSKDKDVAAGVLTHTDQRGGFLSLSIEPPEITPQNTITPREVVFVLDTSGSMFGEPMRASKLFMETALKALRPTDYFRILRFSSETSQFSQKAVRATPDALASALNFVDGLKAVGGTELNNALHTAFDAKQPEGTLRIVVFLTDGYIGADRQVIQTVARRIGDARIYAFGIGQSVNRFLLEGMAKEGRGRARYVNPDETSVEVAQAFAADIGAPLLTDLSIDWNGLTVEGQSPEKIPDLFVGGSVNVLARYQETGKHEIFLNGLVNGKEASMAIMVDLENPGGAAASTSAIPLIWARERIFEKERDYTLNDATDDALKQEITQLRLDFSLQSAFTSFVAVSQKIVNPDPTAAQTRQVALPKVAGVSAGAYPSLNLAGSSAPEPETLLGFAMLLLMSVIRFWKRLKRVLLYLLTRHRKAPQPVDRRLPKLLRRDAWWFE